MHLSPSQKIRVQLQLVWIHAREGWSFDHLKRVTYTVFESADAVLIRLLLANASLLWASFLWLNPYLFDRPAYEIMRVVAPGNVWAWAFFLHFLGVYWRTYDPVPRVLPGLIINAYGFLIWFFTTVSYNYFVGALSPTTASELILCISSAWALYRTGFKRNSIV